MLPAPSRKGAKLAPLLRWRPRRPVLGPSMCLLTRMCRSRGGWRGGEKLPGRGDSAVKAGRGRAQLGSGPWGLQGGSQQGSDPRPRGRWQRAQWDPEGQALDHLKEQHWESYLWGWNPTLLVNCSDMGRVPSLLLWSGAHCPHLGGLLGDEMAQRV